MKLILVMAILVSNAFAVDDETLLALSKKYCEKNVQKACMVLKCAKDPAECKKIPPADPFADVKKKQILDMCQGRQDCIERAIETEKENAMKTIGPFCQAGNQDYCFEKELMESF